MEKIFYDDAIDDALKIIGDRIEYYDCLVRFDKADMIEFELIKELEILRDMVKKLKYYQTED